MLQRGKRGYERNRVKITIIVDQYFFNYNSTITFEENNCQY